MNTHNTDRAQLGDRVITAVGWWTPEVVVAGLTTAGAVWVTPWLWIGTAGVAIWVATHPRLRRYLTRTTTNAHQSDQPRLNTAEATETDADTDARRGWEAAG